MFKQTQNYKPKYFENIDKNRQNKIIMYNFIIKKIPHVKKRHPNQELKKGHIY